MFFYIISGLIGLFYFKNKYDLSFWSAISYGITLGLGMYFGFGAITGIFLIVTGVEEANDTMNYVLIFSGLSALCFWSISRLKKRSRAVDKAKTQNNVQKTIATITETSTSRKSYSFGDQVETKLAGVTFEGRQDLLKNAYVGQKVKVKREPGNVYDTNALSVNVSDDNYISEDKFKDGEDYPYINIDEPHIVEKKIGYINRELAKDIALIFDMQKETYVYGSITSIYHAKNEPSILGAAIKFQLPD